MYRYMCDVRPIYICQVFVNPSEFEKLAILLSSAKNICENLSIHFFYIRDISPKTKVCFFCTVWYNKLWAFFCKFISNYKYINLPKILSFHYKFCCFFRTNFAIYSNFYFRCRRFLEKIIRLNLNSTFSKQLKIMCKQKFNWNLNFVF